MKIKKTRKTKKDEDVKDYGFLSFAKNIGKNISSKHSQKLVKKKFLKKSTKEFPTNEANNEIPKERYISPQERQQIIDGLRLI